MNAEREPRRGRLAAAGMAMVLGAGALAACGSSGGGDAGSDGSTTTASGSGATSTAASGASTTTLVTSTSAGSSTTVTALPDASEAQRTAPSDGTGTALLQQVRVGNNPGFERIVFEFKGSSMPGYRVQWVDPPITADGSGEPVEVKGEAFLEIVMQPASGVDLSAPQLTIVYDGPDRIPVAGQTSLITDLVRTGDFEAVLSWAAGTTERVPFRVLRLTDPTRIVIDLQTS